VDRAYVPIAEAAERLKWTLDALLEALSAPARAERLWTPASEWPCVWYLNREVEGELVRCAALGKDGLLPSSADIEGADVAAGWVSLDPGAGLWLRRDGRATVRSLFRGEYEALLATAVTVTTDQVFVQGSALEGLGFGKSAPQFSRRERRHLLETMGLLLEGLVEERELRREATRRVGTRPDSFRKSGEPNLNGLANYLMARVDDRAGRLPDGLASSTLRKRLKEALESLSEIERPRSG